MMAMLAIETRVPNFVFNIMGDLYVRLTSVSLQDIGEHCGHLFISLKLKKIIFVLNLSVFNKLVGIS